jgi:hypothetical protein
MSRGDYSQKDDPYGIEAEYSAQSASDAAYHSANNSCTDERGNTLTKPRGIPTQAEADAIIEDRSRRARQFRGSVGQA